MKDDKPLLHLTIRKAREALAAKEISSVELVEAHLRRIQERDPDVHAYLEVFDDAIEQAKEADKKNAKGEASPLLGVPIALKDNILVEGKRASAASKILEGYVAPYDATVTRKLKQAGAVLLGRTNMDEFAMGSSTENSAYGVTRNPYDLTRVPGGSSGGSAAAVAMDGALGAFGSDTGGSVRLPAAFCGVVGLKPTYGAVSRYGLMAMGSSLDQIGPLAKTVEDARILFEATKGYDPLDSTSLPDAPSPDKKKEEYTIGVPFDFLQKGIDTDVFDNLSAVMRKLEEGGHRIVEVALPKASHALPAYYILMPAEASTNLARFDGVRYGLHKEGSDLVGDYLETRSGGFGAEVKRRILLGTYVLSAGYYDAYYGKAEQVRNLIAGDYLRAFEKVDAILTPTMPAPAFKIGEKSDPLSMYLTDIFTVPANLTGMPAIAVPSGRVVRGDVTLPLSMQLMAAQGKESTLFEIGSAIEGLWSNP